MKTEFALLCNRCGLSHKEAADFLNVRLDTVKSWSNGRNNAPEGAKKDLSQLYSQIEKTAAQGFDFLSQKISDIGEVPEEIELGVAVDDAEAQALGLPFASCHQVAIALLVLLGRAEGWRFNVVPRGSTVATAGAADAHSK